MMKKKEINHLLVYLVAAVVCVLAVIQSQQNILPQLTGIIEKLLLLIKKTSYGARFLEDYTFRTILTTLPTFLINVVYTVYNGVIGVINQSAWLITMAVYYSLLGILLLLLNLALSGVVLLTIAKGTAKTHSEIMVISIAAYTFYKITMAVINMVKVRKMQSPSLITIRNIGVADALVSILTLQTTMLASFQDTSTIDANQMNGITGLAVCILIALLGASMIYYASKRKES